MILNVPLSVNLNICPCCCHFFTRAALTDSNSSKWSPRQKLNSYSCSSVMSFSLLSSSSLRLLICFWWASRWEWICFSTASWTGKHQIYTFFIGQSDLQKHDERPACWDSVFLLVLQLSKALCLGCDFKIFCGSEFSNGCWWRHSSDVKIKCIKVRNFESISSALLPKRKTVLISTV